MTTTVLEDFKQQIERRELELEVMREELGSRQGQFALLTNRKQELMDELRQVEAEIAMLSEVNAPPPGSPFVVPPELAAGHSGAMSHTPPIREKPSLRDLVVAFVLLALRH